MKEPRSVNEFNDIIEIHKGLIVVKFSTERCQPCRVLRPKFEALSKNHNIRDVLFLEIDAGKLPELAEKYQIESVPTIVYIKYKHVLKTEIGSDIQQIANTIAIFQRI